MILKNGTFDGLAQIIRKKDKRIVVYGAGMIGTVVVPNIIKDYDLQSRVKYFVDIDPRKIGSKVRNEGYEYDIKSPECLRKESAEIILLITNSKFDSIVSYLDSIEELNNTVGYIFPMMQLYELSEMKEIDIIQRTSELIIPKKIHYCWFGGKEMPSFLRTCIESWEKKCPDYEIICWNEDNYDMTKITYVKEAYESKRYGFATDAARLDILYQHGGIYMDTDVTLLKNLDPLLYQEAFVGVEKWGNINSGGGIGAIPKHPMIKEMLDYRKQFRFINEDGSFNMETNGFYETLPFIKYGMKTNNSLQIINGVTVYPSSVFHPYDYLSCEENTINNTFAKHHFYGGWMEKNDLDNRKNTQEKYWKIKMRMESR